MHYKFPKVRFEPQNHRPRFREVHGGVREVRGKIWEVHGKSWDVRGGVRDVRGKIWEVRGKSYHVGGRSWDVRGGSWDVRGRSWDVRGKSYHVRFSFPASPEKIIYMPEFFQKRTKLPAENFRKEKNVLFGKKIIPLHFN